MEVIDNIFSEVGLSKDKWLLKIDDFEQESLICKSKGKSIYKIKEKSSNNIYAAKIFNFNMRLWSKFEETNFLRILQIQSKIDYFFSILQIKGLIPTNFNQKSNPILVFEFAANGNLSNLLEKERKKSSNFLLTQTKKFIIIYGIASGMKHLHSCNIIHQQLQATNILLDDSYYPKISHFNFSKFLSEPQLPNEFDIFSEPSYIAPEIWEHKGYSKSSDVYAFSMIVYEIISNKKLPSKKQKFTKIMDAKIKNEYRPKLTKDIPKCYQKLIKSCWSDNPDKRPKFSEIVDTLNSNPEFYSNEIDKEEFSNYYSLLNGFQLSDSYESYSHSNAKESNKESNSGIEITEFRKVKEIGHYLYDEISIIKNRITNKLYLAKISSSEIDFTIIDNSTLIWSNEIKILSKLNNPTIVKYIGFSLTDFFLNNKPTIIMDFVTNGILENILYMETRNVAPKEWNNTKKLINIFGIAYGMKYLHSLDIIHGDLNPSCILEDKYLTPKICNFGLAKDLNQEKTEIDPQIFKGLVGKSSYMAPEVIFEGEYSKKSDIYSFGMIVYRILTGIEPFVKNDCNQLRKLLMRGTRPFFTYKLTKSCQNLLTKCWDNNILNRPTFSEIVDLLKTDEKIVSDIDKSEFLKYVDFLELNSSSKEVCLSLDIKKYTSNQKFDIQIDRDFTIDLSFYVDLSNLKKLNLIGEGGFGKIFRVEDKTDNKIYVAKISSQNIKPESDDYLILNFCREVNIMSKINHPSIVKFMGFSPINFSHHFKPVILMEYESNGTLADIFILEEKGLIHDSWNDTKKLINIYGIAYGMEYLHSLDIIHRDLKPSNILEDDYLFPKITDFGLSKYVHPDNVNMDFESELEVKGTPKYMAPEVIKNCIYSKKNDIYSFSIILYQFFSCNEPLKGKNMIDIMKMMENCERLEFDFPIPIFYKNLIERCWDEDFEKRPAFSEIVELLKTDDAITENVDKDEFFQYVNYIESFSINTLPKKEQNTAIYRSFINEIKKGNPTILPIKFPPERNYQSIDIKDKKLDDKTQIIFQKQEKKDDKTQKEDQKYDDDQEDKNDKATKEDQKHDDDQEDKDDKTTKEDQKYDDDQEEKDCMTQNDSQKHDDDQEGKDDMTQKEDQKYDDDQEEKDDMTQKEDQKYDDDQEEKEETPQENDQKMLKQNYDLSQTHFNKIKINYDNFSESKNIVISVSIPKIDIDKFEKIELIGNGAFAKVYKIQDKEKNNIYAAKILNKNREFLDDNDIKSITREISIFPKMDHESIIKFIGYSLVNFKHKEKPVFVIEYEQNGTLGDILKLERKGFALNGWDDTKKLINIYGIACAMKYLHEQSILHRDLKPDNVLLDEYLYPKITDFGLSRTYNRERVSEHITSTLGTPIYVSPEIWDSNDHSCASDVYAFAFIVYEIITLEKPLKNFKNLYQIRNEVLNKHYRPKFEVPIAPCYKKLIELCWLQNDFVRPTFNDIVNELKTNPGFITKNIDFDEFVLYTELIGEQYPLNNSSILRDHQHIKTIQKVNKVSIPHTAKEITELTISTFQKIIETEKSDPTFYNCFLNLSKFEQKKMISKGEFNKVIQVLETETRKKYAARISNIDMNQFTENEMRDISIEIKAFSQIDHPCILKFIGFSPTSFKNEPKPVIITELVKTTPLKSILNDERKKGIIQGWNKTAKLKFIYGVASAMCYLHSHGILHRNLTPSNILLTKSFHPKLSDFGLCTHLLILNSMTFQSTSKVKNSPVYLSPEMMSLNECTEKSDIYSFGMIVYEIYSMQKPFRKLIDFVQIYDEVVVKKKLPEITDEVPQSFQKLIKECLCYDQNMRPKFADIINKLKNDQGFITSDVNKESYLKYVNKISTENEPKKHHHKHHHHRHHHKSHDNK